VLKILLKISFLEGEMSDEPTPVSFKTRVREFENRLAPFFYWGLVERVPDGAVRRINNQQQQPENKLTTPNESEA
jgi:hypothetical protein